MMIKHGGYERTFAEVVADPMPVSTQFDTQQNQSNMVVYYHTELTNKVGICRG